MFHFYSVLPHTYTFLRISFIFGLPELQLSMAELCLWQSHGSYSSRNGFQGLVDFVQYLKWVLGPINNDHTHHLFHLTWWLVGYPNSWVVLGVESQHLPLVFLEWVWEEVHHCQLGTDFQGSRSCWQWWGEHLLCGNMHYVWTINEPHLMSNQWSWESIHLHVTECVSANTS